MVNAKKKKTEDAEKHKDNVPVIRIAAKRPKILNARTADARRKRNVKRRGNLAPIMSNVATDV